MLGIQQVTGQSGLTTVLSQAGLRRYAGELPPNNRELVISAAEYAALMQALENYYGRGARGILLRVGHAAFGLLRASQPLTTGAYQLVFPLLPLATRIRLALQLVAAELAGAGGRAEVRFTEGRWVLVDFESDATRHRVRDTEICWATLGAIQAALAWSTGREHDVTETACRARGAPACRFEIGDTLE
jgi:predicted hydrocarbon binding protein